MTMFMLYLLPLFMLLSGVMVYISNRAHLLATLLSLEFIVLALFLTLFEALNFLNYENFFSMMFLTFSVCEGALGLSVLVSMIRTHGNDYFQTFSILQC
uniref:NADH-ubiquinone oxidoreductase chain 4L n=1 Tax=Simulium jisigouense TaxID=2893561 RepID=A0A9Y2TCH3_9DIPT|nr:NADH dehydrogenase subunit 4L [Simulium jisigouense]WIV81718.1 NADH dehydrogenase subunit 4L [Simulium jisigouense]